MSSLEEIKKKLNIENMDEATRKEMFNKFVEGGGEVIKEKPVSQAMQFNRDKQIEFSEKFNSNKIELEEKYSSGKKNKSHKSAKGAKSDKKKHVKYPFSIFIRGFFKGFFTIGGNFNRKYINSMETDFAECISSLSNCAKIIALLENDEKWKMVEYLNVKFPFAYELMLRIYDLYKPDNIQEIKNYFIKEKKIQCPSIIQKVKLLYKELLIILPFWETNKNTLWDALNYYEKLSQKRLPISKQIIEKNFDQLFNYYLPLIHITMQYNLGESVPFEVDAMKKFAGVTEEEDLGIYTGQLDTEKENYMIEKEKEKEEQRKKLQETVEQKEMEKIPIYIQKGLKVIDELLEKKDSTLKNDKNASLFEPNEKMLILYVLLNEFEHHYAFLLTTSQLKLTSRLENGVRTDIRSEFDEEFMSYNSIINYQNEYIELLQDLTTTKIELQNNPIQLQIKTSAINVKRVTVLNEIKSTAASFFLSFSKTLQKLINDYKNEDKKLLQNPEEQLDFQLSRSKNRFDKLPAIKAIAAAYTFSAALHYYMTYSNFNQRGLYCENDDNKGKK